MRACRIAALLLGLSAVPTAAQEFSGSVSLTSDYRLRGVSQDDRNPTPQAELDWNGPDGWSAGLLMAKIDFEDHERTTLETDLFVNRHVDVGKTGLDLTVFYYGYPDHRPRPGSPRYSMIEPSVKVSREWNGVSASVMLAWSPDFFGETGMAWDAEAGLSYPVTPWLSVSGHAGLQWVRHWDQLSGSGFPYDYGDLGLTASLGDWSFDARYEWTTLSPRQCLATQGGLDWCQGSVLVTVRYSL